MGSGVSLLGSKSSNTSNQPKNTSGKILEESKVSSKQSEKKGETGSTKSGKSERFSLFSTLTSTLSGEELTAKKKQQEKIGQFVVNHFFYAIPISTRKKTSESISPVWIEPQEEILEQSLAGNFPQGQVSRNYCLNYLSHQTNRILWRMLPLVF